jgi:hypothetical protein
VIGRGPRVLGALLAASALLACSRRMSADAARATPPTHIDSVVPRAEALQRFRATLTSHPTALSGGAASTDALVHALASALEARDTARVARLGITRDEFGELIYPASPLSLPPYDLSPDLMWFQLEGNSSHGLSRALAQRSGMPLHIIGVSCPTTDRQGENIVHGRCTVRRVLVAGDTISDSIFGSIIQRGGRFKILSFSNAL